MQNLILNTDSYKTSHFVQYPQGAEFVSSYIESRGGVHASTVFFGLQMFIMQYLTKPITLADIDEAEMICSAHGVPFNREGWMHILTVHNGYLPLEIEAVPEKASAICINGAWKDVYKDPITDQGKRSKKGRLALTKVNGQFQTVTRDSANPTANELVTVFRNGKLVTEYTLDQVRNQALGQTQSNAA